MNSRKGLVLDANILLRAVFGTRVRQRLETHEHVARFCSPDVVLWGPKDTSGSGQTASNARDSLGQRIP
jgi:hypothetical protein